MLKNIRRLKIDLFKVRGCGKDSGFQLTLDTRGHFSNQGISESIELGFQVFITLNGVVTSHVPYFVSAGFNGEHNFYLHGIHNIVVKIGLHLFDLNNSFYLG